MKTRILLLLTASLISISFSGVALAEDDTKSSKEPSTKSSPMDSKWTQELKTEYKLTDEQIKSLQDRGISGKDAVRLADLSKLSGKTLDEVVAMRMDQKMGWGNIAKKLGVSPKEIGQSVAKVHRSDKSQKDNSMAREKERGESGEKHGGGEGRGHGKGGH